MSFPKTLFPILSLALFLSLPALPPASAQTAARPPVAATAAGYGWRTLVLRHAVPSDILALMHWKGAPEAPSLSAPGLFDLLPLTGHPAPTPPALPIGVRRIFALRSNNSLLVEATQEGFATVAKIVNILDIAPRQVEFHLRLVAVPATDAGVYVPDVPASRLLPLLLEQGARVTAAPVETVTEGTTAAISIGVPVLAPVRRFRLAQAGTGPGGYGPSARCEFRLTPRINADGTVTLSLTPASDAPLSLMQPAPPRTVRAGEMVVYEVTGAGAADGERLFLFLSALVIGETEDAPDGGQLLSGQTVIVTP